MSQKAYGSVVLNNHSVMSVKVPLVLKKKQPLTNDGEKKTRVVCVNVKDIRPKYQNLKEWIEDPNHEYIARGGPVFIGGARYPKHDSVWANPFKVGRDGTREEIIELYRQHIQQKLDSNEITREQLEALRGKTLGCWCKPEPCHGDILLEFLGEVL